MIVGMDSPISTNAVTASKYKGSPILPGSFVLSKTAIFLAVLGIFSIKSYTENGRYKRTIKAPTFSPFSTKVSIVSLIGPSPEPITIITFSASG